jgi:hypothetical protein
MKAIKTRYDGEKVIVPDELKGLPPSEVILVVQDQPVRATESSVWAKAQEAAFAKVWDNDEDAVYDAM